MDDNLARQPSPPRPGEARRPASARVHDIQHRKVTLWRVLKALGPGLIAGASDDDPAAIASYSVAGARYGFALLWVAPLALPMAMACTFLAAKVGLVGGVGLAGAIRKHYSRWLLYPTVLTLIAANTLEAAADLGLMADSLHMFVNLRFKVLVLLIGSMALVLQIWGSYGAIKAIFKYLALALFAYVGAAILAKPNPREVLLGTFAPSIQLDTNYLSLVLALLGATLSPYLFFWEASEHVEEKVQSGRKSAGARRGATHRELQYAAWDVRVGMLFANIAAYAVMVCAGATLHRAGSTDIQSASDAAKALQPLLGNAAGYLFATGIIAVGFLAVPVLISGAAYAMAEMFRWNYGLSERPARASQFYMVIGVCTLVALGIDFLGINVIRLLVISAVMQGVLAAPMMLLLLLITNNRAVMAEQTNGRVLNVVAGATTIIMFAAAVALLWNWVRR